MIEDLEGFGQGFMSGLCRDMCHLLRKMTVRNGPVGDTCLDTLRHIRLKFIFSYQPQLSGFRPSQLRR